MNCDVMHNRITYNCFLKRITKAFTLAEVLITLTMVGVITSLTIPSLVNSINNFEYNVGIKKIYADLSNAVLMIQANSGGSVAVGVGSTAEDYAAFRDDFCKVMSCIKKDSAANVFAGIMYKNYKGGDWASMNSNVDLAAILNNGTLLYFVAGSNCNNWGVNMCGFINVDINGHKGPNMWGMDLYRFYVVRKQATGSYTVLPAGIQGDTVAPASTTCVVGNGEGCTAVRLSNPDDMP